MSDRTIDIPGIHASAATTVIPSYPTPGSGYRKGDMSSADIINGFLYGNIADSSIMNQLMFIITSLIQQLASQGFLSWCATTAYTVPSFAIGSDGKVYTALVASTGVNPVGDVTGKWKAFISAGSIVGPYATIASGTAQKIATQTIHCTNRDTGYTYDFGSAVSFAVGSQSASSGFTVTWAGSVVTVTSQSDGANVNVLALIA